MRPLETDISPDSWLCAAVDMANEGGGQFMVKSVTPDKDGRMLVQVANGSGEVWGFLCYRMK